MQTPCEAFMGKISARCFQRRHFRWACEESPWLRSKLVSRKRRHFRWACKKSPGFGVDSSLRKNPFRCMRYFCLQSVLRVYQYSSTVAIGSRAEGHFVIVANFCALVEKDIRGGRAGKKKAIFRSNGADVRFHPAQEGAPTRFFGRTCTYFSSSLRSSIKKRGSEAPTVTKSTPLTAALASHS